jgi:hypothetical protein
MIYTIGSLLILGVIWMLVSSQDRTLEMERRYWIETRRLSGHALADRRKRNR